MTGVSITCPILDHPPVSPGCPVVFLAQKTPWMDKGSEINSGLRYEIAVNNDGVQELLLNFFLFTFLLKFYL